jgi:hypothetical protein
MLKQRKNTTYTFASIIILNGIDSSAQSKESHEKSTENFANRYPEAKIKIFNAFDQYSGRLREGYLQDKANLIVTELQRSIASVTVCLLERHFNL